ncbi:hypothetical protein EYR36_011971 [Pleurotus pulmonarius]|nr:hypothetical protein EYR36_011971 [Pleurotus pulmonarius]
MGGCMSTPGVPVTEQEKAMNREAEKQLREAKAKLEKQVKVLLLGSGDSGKSTILKQMRVIHHVPFSAQEIELFRQLVFNNLTVGLKYVLDAMQDMDLKVSEENLPHMELIEEPVDVRDGDPFPLNYLEPLKSLWADPNVQRAWERGNEAALPENLLYFFDSLDRLFDPEYQPTESDIIQCRARTTGITETTFQLKDHEMLMVDVGGQKSERRKWIHCFQDVTSILFLVSLSGYDQCLVEDKDAILFLNKNDLFQRKIPTSDIKNFFPDYEGEPGDVRAGRDYFKKRFARLAQKAGRSKEREIYIHITTATDTAMLRVVMAAVEE